MRCFTYSNEYTITLQESHEFIVLYSSVLVKKLLVFLMLQLCPASHQDVVNIVYHFLQPRGSQIWLSATLQAVAMQYGKRR